MDLRNKVRIYDFGPFRFNTGTGMLYDSVSDKSDKLAPTLRDLLTLFVQNAGQLIPADDILEKVWEGRSISDEAFYNAIHRLRKELGDSDTKKPQYIENKDDRRYCFISPIREVKNTPEEIIIALWSFPDDERRDPLRKQFYLLQAMSKSLSNIPNFIVKNICQTPFEDRFKTAREAEAKYILIIGLRKDADFVRINASLEATADCAVAWSFEDTVVSDSVFNTEDKITSLLTRSFHKNAIELERVRLPKLYTDNNDAYIAYKRGKELWEQMHLKSFKKAEEYFNEALKLDRHYLKPIVGLSDILVWNVIYGRVAPIPALKRAGELALKALNIDKDLAGANNSRAYTLLLSDRDFEQAEAAFRRAVDINPNYANAYQGYALLELIRGKYDSALEKIRIAVEIKPESFLNMAISGIIWYLCGKHDQQALNVFDECLRRNVSFDAAYFGRALVYLKMKNYAEAISDAKKALEFSENGTINQALLGYIFAISGNRREAKQIADDLSNNAERRYISAFNLSLVYLALDESDPARLWLNRAEKELDPWYLLKNRELRLNK